jgi:hypothetical protein
VAFYPQVKQPKKTVEEKKDDGPSEKSDLPQPKDNVGYRAKGGRTLEVGGKASVPYTALARCWQEPCPLPHPLTIGAPCCRAHAPAFLPARPGVG